MNVSISTYSDTAIFAAKVKSIELTRAYEEDEYAFIASDVKLDMLEASELYRSVLAGTTVYLAVAITKDGTTTRRFRGIFQADGAEYDPETEVYSLNAVHIVKSLFNTAKARLETSPDGITYSTDDGLKAALSAFDLVATNTLHGRGICSVVLNPSDFEFANTTGKKNDKYFDFLKENESYSLRDFWLDFAKHYRALLFVSDDYDSSGMPVLKVVPRLKYADVLHTGYDDLIASYKETDRDAQYASVIISYKVKQGSYVSYYYGEYRSDGLHPYVYPTGAASVNTEDALDLRVPDGMWAKSDDELNAVTRVVAKDPDYYPFDSIPVFSMVTVNGRTSISGLTEYCSKHFDRFVKPFKEVEVLYHDLVPALNPFELLSIRGSNALMMSITDEYVDETTKVVGRVFA
jgi:hypothetical protein